MTTWTVTEVSQATGLSEGAISGYFSNRGIKTKGGLNLVQILEVLTSTRRNHGTNNSEKVKKLVRILNMSGFSTLYECDKEEE